MVLKKDVNSKSKEYQRIRILLILCLCIRRSEWAA